MMGNLNVVAVGGGTGLSSLLKGLKKEVGITISDLTAIVTVADSGGSTGKLRKIYNIPAPGDIRNCIVALPKQKNLCKSFSNTGLKGMVYKDTLSETFS